MKQPINKIRVLRETRRSPPGLITGSDFTSRLCVNNSGSPSRERRRHLSPTKLRFSEDWKGLRTHSRTVRTSRVPRSPPLRMRHSEDTAVMNTKRSVVVLSRVAAAVAIGMATAAAVVSSTSAFVPTPDPTFRVVVRLEHHGRHRASVFGPTRLSPTPTGFCSNRSSACRQVRLKGSDTTDQQPATGGVQVFDPLGFSEGEATDSNKNGATFADVQRRQEKTNQEQAQSYLASGPESLLVADNGLVDDDNNQQIGIWAARAILLLVAAIWGTNFAVSLMVLKKPSYCLVSCVAFFQPPRSKPR